MKKLAIIHTSSATIEPLRQLAAELLPGVFVMNWLDDSILPELIASDGDLSLVRNRWTHYAQFAIQGGASVVLSACSSVGELADEIRQQVKVPVLRIDRPMAEEAVRRADRIGVIATVSATLGPTTRLLQSTADANYKEIEIAPLLVTGAYAELMAGHLEIHNRLLIEAIGNLSAEVQLILLAQASMARVIPDLPANMQNRILTSPRSGMQNAALIMEKLHG